MVEHSHLDPAPFFLEGGPTGVLLLHGFTGAPPEMRLLGDYLNRQGFTVSAPLLPGHGTTPQDMNLQRWTDWTAHAAQALASLRRCCPTVFVGGLSMGALLSLYLAADHPGLAGVMAYSPAIFIGDSGAYLAPLFKHFIATVPARGQGESCDPEVDRYLWCYSETPLAAVHELLRMEGQVRRALPRVTIPLLVVYSTGDRTIRADSGRYTYEHAASREKELMVVHNSRHCVTVDREWQAVAARTNEFICKHSPPA